MDTSDLPITASWLSTDTSAWKTIGGLTPPSKGQAFFLEGYATDDGVTFEYPPFEAGRLDVVVALLPTDQANLAVEWVSKKMLSASAQRRAQREENEMVVGLWPVSDTESLVVAGDAGGIRQAQEALDEVLDKLKVQECQMDQVERLGAFDVTKIPRTGRVAEAIKTLTCPQASAAPPTVLELEDTKSVRQKMRA